MSPERREQRFDKYTERSYRVIHRSKEIALAQARDTVSASDIFLSLMMEDDGLAVKTLSKLGLDKGPFQEAVRKLHSAVSDIATKYNDLDDEAKQVLDLAEASAKHFNRHYIGTEHLLIGLAESIKQATTNTIAQPYPTSP